MAEGLNEPRPSTSAAEEHAVGRALAAPSRQTGRGSSSSPYSHKFLVVTAMLVGIALGAVAVAIVVLATHTSKPAAAMWSTWSPPDSGLAGEREIADEVSPFYRASPAGQLVVVTVQNVSAPSANGSGSGTQLALRDPTNGTLSAISGTSAVFNLCGLGPGCAITPGAPSQARELLLRREALELALYTFRYIGNVQNVVSILPPGHATQTCTGICSQPNPPKTTKTVDLAVVFQRQSLQHFLERPLRDTLPEELPPTVAEMPDAPEAELVSVITGQALFQHQLVQAQDGSSVLVLSPEPPQ